LSKIVRTRPSTGAILVTVGGVVSVSSACAAGTPMTTAPRRPPQGQSRTTLSRHLRTPVSVWRCWELRRRSRYPRGRQCGPFAGIRFGAMSLVGLQFTRRRSQDVRSRRQPSLHRGPRGPGPVL